MRSSSCSGPPPSTARRPGSPSERPAPWEQVTVILALTAAATWGAGDFAGGMLVRRGPLLGVVLVSQLVGWALALVLAIVRGETTPLPADIPWSIAGGLSGGIGIVALYRGLAIGRMGVVAPVTGVIAAAIPVTFGILIEGSPAPTVALGIGLPTATPLGR